MPIDGYFDTVFAAAGDKVTVPDPVQGGGTVSYEQGYPIGYSTPVDSGGILITRTSMNQLFYDLTTALQQYQQVGTPPFITTAMNGGTPYSYSKYDRASFGGVSYTSTADTNTDTPPSANWVADSLGTTFTTGMVVMTLQPTPSSGWVFCNDGTIGSATSGATTRANADTMALFEMIWNSVSNTYAPVPGGRGANAAADFAANKKITLPAMLGRALAVAGTGAGLTARTLGETFGEENHALTAPENGPHTHTINDPGHAHTIVAIASSGGVSSSQILAESDGLTTMPTSTATTGITINSEGSGTAHNTMQPTTFLNAMIKL